MKSQFIRITLIVALVVVASISCLAQSLDLPESVLTSLEQEWSGSGAIISSDGYILTNNHVIEGATTIEVVLASGRSYDASVIEAKPDLDLALIKIDAEDLPAIPIDADREMKQGYAVVSIGSPKGLVGTMSTGIITALDRDTLGLQGLYQTNADIAPGSSGGPLIDEYGNLIGINVAVAQEGGVSLTAFGFAIPIGRAVELLELVPRGRFWKAGMAGWKERVPAPRELSLSTPEIAELCSPATVYILCAREVPLLSLLPTALSVYPGGGAPIFYDSASDAFTPPPEDYFTAIMLEEAFTKPLEGRSSRQSRDWAMMMVGGDDFDLEVLFSGGHVISVISCEDSQDGERVAELEREYEMDGCTAVSRGTYTVGSLVADWEIGWTVEVPPFPKPSEPLFHDDRWGGPLGGPTASIRRRAALRSVASLALEDVVLVVSSMWFSECYESQTWGQWPFGGSSNYVEYEMQDGCVIEVITRVKRELNQPTETKTRRTELICVDEFESVAQSVFQDALSALAAAL